MFHDDYPDYPTQALSEDLQQKIDQYVFDMGNRLAEQIDRAALKEFGERKSKNG